MNTSSEQFTQPPGLAVERARVVSVQRSEGGDSTVWVEAFERNTCGKCSARDACGQGVLQRWFARRQRHFPVRCAPAEASLLAVGQWVEIAIPEGALSRAAALAYLVPLVGLLAAAMLAEQYDCSDLQVAASAAAGFGVGMLLARRIAGRLSAATTGLEPRLLGLAAS